MSENIPEFLKRAAEKCGFVRDYHIDQNLPTNPDNIVVAHFFGDLRNEFVLSSLILKRFREELRGSKYMVLCTWKGHRGLFPYCNEIWSPADVHSQVKLRGSALGFDNTSEVYTLQRQNLNYFFRHLITPEDAQVYYSSGLTSEYHKKLKTVKRWFPSVPSVSYLDQAFNQGMVNKPGYKVLVMPCRFGRGFVNGQLTNIRSCREFWFELVLRLTREGYSPVVVQNHMTFDLSGDFHDKAIFVQEEDVSKIIGMMRSVGLVLDVFNGSSRLAISARTPFVAVDSRSRFGAEREFEIDSLCAPDIPKQYIFSFPTLIEGGDHFAWNLNLFDNVVSKLNGMVKSVDIDGLPSTSESNSEIPFDVVREHKAKRIGTRFVKVDREEEE